MLRHGFQRDSGCAGSIALRLTFAGGAVSGGVERFPGDGSMINGCSGISRFRKPAALHRAVPVPCFFTAA